MKALAALLVALLVIGGAYIIFQSDPLTQELNTRWPPVKPDEQRQKAINTAEAALKLLPHPNIAAGVDIHLIEKLTSEKLKDAGLSKVQLRGDKQLLRLTAEFHRRFSADDLPLKFEQRDLVHRLQPEITGELDLFLGAAGTLVSTPSRIIQLRALLKTLKCEPCHMESNVIQRSRAIS
jgi:hypothetical protein